MPLSIAKLQDLLYEKGFLSTRYFIMDGACFYIELYSRFSADTFFLYMPSRYNFEPPTTADAVYKIKYIDMTLEENKADEYTGGDIGRPDQAIQLSPDRDKLEEHLENNYKHQISLKDISDEDTAVLKTIYRQMRRLRYCVQNLKYKLGVVYKNYICAIRRDDTIDCFIVKHLSRQDSKKLLVIVDLETFYEKNDKLLEDISTVRDSVYQILERNQNMHTRVIDKMVQNRKDIAVIPEYTEKKKAIHEALLRDYTNLLQVMNNAEKKVVDEIRALDGSEPTGLQSDITRAHQKTRLDKEIAKIRALKEEISRGIAILREKRENSLINVDNLMFDNTIMWDCMVKNFSRLKEYC